MKAPDTDMHFMGTQDKQLQGITLEAALEKRRLDQALNAKEFAVCAGVSYSTARAWFQLPNFPVFQGVIFWQDFVQWRADQLGLGKPPVTASDLSKILDESGSLGPYRARRFNRGSWKGARRAELSSVSPCLINEPEHHHAEKDSVPKLLRINMLRHARSGYGADKYTIACVIHQKREVLNFHCTCDRVAATLKP